jgi:hypothetical protein
VLSTDPIDLLLDDDGDLKIGTGIEFSQGAAAVRQALQFRLGLFLGEWFLDLDSGIPYFQDFLGQKYSQAHARDVFRAAILETPGVKSIVSLVIEFDRSTRLMTVDFRVVAGFDDTEEEVSGTTSSLLGSEDLG